MKTKEVKGTPAPPENRDWLRYLQRLRESAPERYEDAAKFLVTLVSLTLAITTTGYEKLGQILLSPVLALAILLPWLFSLFCAFQVLFPQRYDLSGREVDKIKSTHNQIIRRKRRWFLAPDS